MILDLRPTEATALIAELADTGHGLRSWSGGAPEPLADVLDKLTSRDYDTFTEAAGLLLDNERAQSEQAAAYTRGTLDTLERLAVYASPDDLADERQGMTSRLADALRHTVENHPDIARVYERGTFACDFVRRALDAVDWHRLARDWMAEEQIQRGQVTP